MDNDNEMLNCVTCEEDYCLRDGHDRDFCSRKCEENCHYNLSTKEAQDE